MFFVISCSANIYRPFLNWRIWEMYMSIGKHYLHMNEYSILQLFMQAHRLHIKIAELNTHSDGNGIIQAYLVQFFNEMGNKKKKIWKIKIRTNLRNSSQLHTFSFFKCKFWEISNDCKISVSAHQSCTIEVFRLETTGILQYLEVFYILFWSWKTRGFFFTFKKKIP